MQSHHKIELLSYVERYAPAGQYVMSVLRNDLGAAVLHGSSDDLAALPEMLAWLYQYAPLKSWGSARAVADWVAHFSG